VPGGAASLSKRPISPTSLSLFAERISVLHEWSSNYLNHPPSRGAHQRPDLDLGDYSDGTEMNTAKSLLMVCQSSLRNCHAENLRQFCIIRIDWIYLWRESVRLRSAIGVFSNSMVWCIFAKGHSKDSSLHRLANH
jgi:hypothetical protein